MFSVFGGYRYWTHKFGIANSTLIPFTTESTWITGATIAILFVCQPESAETTRVYKLLARDDLGGDRTKLAAFARSPSCT